MLHCKIIFVEKNLISLKPTAYSNHSQIPVWCRRLRRPAKRNELFKIVQEQNVNSLNRCKVRAPHRKRAGRKYNMEISYYSLFLGSPKAATPTIFVYDFHFHSNLLACFSQSVRRSVRTLQRFCITYFLSSLFVTFILYKKKSCLL